MADSPFSNRKHAATGPPLQPLRPSASPAQPSPSFLAELTPSGLFTNLFRVTVPPGSVGTVRSAPTYKAEKDEFDGWKKPVFYQARKFVYVFGPGVEQFSDRRFTSAIVTAETDRNFTKFLLGQGLGGFFRDREFLVHPDMQGFRVQDHQHIIKSSSKEVLHIIPQFVFQPYWVEMTNGKVCFAFSIEPGTTVLPTFHVHWGLRRFAGELADLRMQLQEGGCRSGCPLYGRQGQIIGRFKGFAKRGAPLDCTCHENVLDPVPIRVAHRHRKPGTPRPKRNGPKPETVETTLTIPGQLLGAAPAQRRLLRLSHDRANLERAGRVWLGDLTPGGSIRGDALKTRYMRIQEFLTRLAGGSSDGIPFTLPTGGQAILERTPLVVEALVATD